MRIPTDKQGRPQVSITQLRAYGADDLRLDTAEAAKGCPRYYHRKYVAGDVPPEPRSEHLEFGSVMHRALFLMESDAIGPEDALQRAWSPMLSPGKWQEAVDVLQGYLARGGPMVRFATLDHELDLAAELYVDEDYGPVMVRGVVDWLGLDVNEAGMLHGVDYKGQARPPARADVEGDIQLKCYQYLIGRNWGRWMRAGSPPRIVMHLDALRYGDVAVMFTSTQIAEWREWASAVVRRMLRDEDAEPQLNDGCSYCPVRHDCPKWLGLPGAGETLLMRQAGTDDPGELWARRQEMFRVRKLLDAAVDNADEQLKQATQKAGQLRFADQHWKVVPAFEDDVDWHRLQGLLGDDLWQVVATSKTALERYARRLDPSERAEVLACVGSTAAGTRVKRGKVSRNDD